jgi:hypothetical protein
MIRSKPPGGQDIGEDDEEGDYFGDRVQPTK